MKFERPSDVHVEDDGIAEVFTAWLVLSVSFLSQRRERGGEEKVIGRGSKEHARNTQYFNATGMNVCVMHT